MRGFYKQRHATSPATSLQEENGIPSCSLTATNAVVLPHTQVNLKKKANKNCLSIINKDSSTDLVIFRNHLSVFLSCS